MTFDEAVAEADGQGWYVYQLCFEPASEGFNDCWSCTLRALSGQPRRQISRATGAEAVEAICNALVAAPELEEDITVYAGPVEVKIDLVALMRKQLKPLKRRI